MTIEQADRYMDYVKWGLADKVQHSEEPTAEERAFLKSIVAWDEDDEDDDDDRDYWLDFGENAPD